MRKNELKAEGLKPYYRSINFETFFLQKKESVKFKTTKKLYTFLIQSTASRQSSVVSIEAGDDAIRLQLRQTIHELKLAVSSLFLNMIPVLEHFLSQNCTPSIQYRIQPFSDRIFNLLELSNPYELQRLDTMKWKEERDTFANQCTQKEAKIAVLERDAQLARQRINSLEGEIIRN